MKLRIAQERIQFRSRLETARPLQWEVKSAISQHNHTHCNSLHIHATCDQSDPLYTDLGLRLLTAPQVARSTAAELVTTRTMQSRSTENIQTTNNSKRILKANKNNKSPLKTRRTASISCRHSHRNR